MSESKSMPQGWMEGRVFPIFCVTCGSASVDVWGWDGETAKIRCSVCSNQSTLTGFTLGRYDGEHALEVEAEATKDAPGPDGRSFAQIRADKLAH